MRYAAARRDKLPIHGISAAAEGQARGVQIEHRKAKSRVALSHGGGARRRLHRDATRHSCRCLDDTRAESSRRPATSSSGRATSGGEDEHEERHAHAPADPINPGLVIWELTVSVCRERGSSPVTRVRTAYWLGRDIRPPSRHDGVGVREAWRRWGAAFRTQLAAKLAHPGSRRAIALVGDGAMQMSGITRR